MGARVVVTTGAGAVVVVDAGVQATRLMRYWLVLIWSYMLSGSMAAAPWCNQQEIWLKSKSTATHDGTLAQYAWHACTVVPGK